MIAFSLLSDSLLLVLMELDKREKGLFTSTKNLGKFCVGRQ